MVETADKSSEGKKFNADEISVLIKEIIENAISDSEYSHSKVSTWNSTIIENCLTKLKSLDKNRKYVVTCIILQNKGVGFYAGSSVYWDSQNDGSASYRYESKSLYAIVNVFSLKI